MTRVRRRPAPPVDRAPAATATAVWVTRAVRLAAATASLIGGSYLVAWLSGVAPRWSASNVITMKTNMSLALVLAGTALGLLSGRPGPRARTTAIVASVVVLLIGMLTLSEHLFRLDLGIDQLLATEPPGALATASPNRVGPPGATSLVLLGAGLLALAWRRRIALYLGLATGFIVLVPAVGFLYGVGHFYATARTGIAWPTVIALLSLAIGLILVHARYAGVVLWRADAGGVLLRRLLLPIVLIPVGLGYLRIEGERHGLFDAPTGTGLFALSMILLFSAFLWRNAAQLSAAATDARTAADAMSDSEERLRAAVQRLESLLENSPLAVVEWSSVDFRIARWSGEATRMFGWTAEDVAGKRIDELSLVYPEDWPLVKQVMVDMQSGARERNVSWNRNVRKDGSVLHCEWYNSTVTDATGKLTGVLSLVLDVTERNRTEAALREADQRKSEFLSVLSHELRNPLAPIRNGVYLLERAPPGSEQAARAREVIRRQTAHLTRLVDDLLDVTRIARGKIELHRRRIDLCEVVPRACEDHRGLFDARGIPLRVETSGPAWVDADETRIAQVVGNLLQNATKFGGEGGTVTASVGAVDGHAEIHVRDAGVGMTLELTRRVFEPFVQADEGLARTKGGLGLGLALVKGLVELHGGSVSASSAGPNLGSEFVVRFPIAPAPDAASTNAFRTPPRAPVASSGGRVLDILLVEDNLDAAHTLADVLRLEGHRVRIASDGGSGIASAREHPPDVVLCDIGLPGLDGYEVARALRGDPALAAVRLIALTGYAQPTDRARAREAGFEAHLPKPPPLETLFAMLGEPRRE